MGLAGNTGDENDPWGEVQTTPNQSEERQRGLERDGAVSSKLFNCLKADLCHTRKRWSLGNSDLGYLPVKWLQDIKELPPHRCFFFFSSQIR